TVSHRDRFTHRHRQGDGLFWRQAKRAETHREFLEPTKTTRRLGLGVEQLPHTVGCLWVYEGHPRQANTALGWRGIEHRRHELDPETNGCLIPNMRLGSIASGEGLSCRGMPSAHHQTRLASA